MGRRALITGLSTFWGGRLAQALEADPDVEVIIGLDTREPQVHLERTEPGKNGEIQLTDALQEMAEHEIAGGVIGVVFRGRRYDTGDKLDYLKAIVQLASEREDLGDQFRPWLQEFVAGF